jgi:hypothetical protein
MKDVKMGVIYRKNKNAIIILHEKNYNKIGK